MEESAHSTQCTLDMQAVHVPRPIPCGTEDHCPWTDCFNSFSACAMDSDDGDGTELGGWGGVGRGDWIRDW